MQKEAELRILWEAEIGDVAFRVTQYPEEYNDQRIWFWKRERTTTKGKTRWSVWTHIDAIDEENEIEEELDEDGEPMSPPQTTSPINPVWELILQMAQDAGCFRTYYDEFTKRAEMPVTQEPELPAPKSEKPEKKGQSTPAE